MRIAPTLRIAPRLLSAFAIAIMVAACGGGGDSDGGGGGVDITDDPAPPMPTTVTFNVGTKDSARLTLTADGISIAYPLLAYNGTWNRTAQAWTLSGRTGVDSGPALFGAFQVASVVPVSWTGDSPPTSGKLEFITPAGNSFFLPQLVQATFDTGTPPVLLTYGPSTIRYDWDAYLSLWPDDTQPREWRLASFGGTVSFLVADRTQLILDLMAYINANDTRIASAGAAGLVTDCSPRPGAATGTRKIALANPDGELNPGDGLVVTYTNCWVDDPTDNIDLLYNGSITLNGYIENKTPFSTGFDEFRFNSLSEQETETVGSVVNVDPLPIVTTGTMTLFVTP